MMVYQMMVNLGLPASSRTRIRGEMDSTFTIFSVALGDSRKPTPPTEEFKVFLVAEEVISW